MRYLWPLVGLFYGVIGMVTVMAIVPPPPTNGARIGLLIMAFVYPISTFFAGLGAGGALWPERTNRDRAAAVELCYPDKGQVAGSARECRIGSSIRSR